MLEYSRCKITLSMNTSGMYFAQVCLVYRYLPSYLTALNPNLLDFPHGTGEARATLSICLSGCLLHFLAGLEEPGLAFSLSSLRSMVPVSQTCNIKMRLGFVQALVKTMCGQVTMALNTQLLAKVLICKNGVLKTSPMQYILPNTAIPK